MVWGLYARVSTEEQAEDGQSIDAQLRALRTWATQQGHAVREFVDQGKSAYTEDLTKRPAFKEMLEAMRAGELGGIAVTHIDLWWPKNPSAFIQTVRSFQSKMRFCEPIWMRNGTSTGGRDLDAKLEQLLVEAQRTTKPIVVGHLLYEGDSYSGQLGTTAAGERIAGR